MGRLDSCRREVMAERGLGPCEEDRSYLGSVVTISRVAVPTRVPLGEDLGPE